MIALRSTPWHTARWRWPALIFAFAIGLMSIGVGQAHAWSTSQTAKAVCDGTVKVNATFTNTEPVGSGLDMVVTTTVGTLSGGAKTVKVGETESFTVDLGVYTTSGGTVTFALKWVDRSGTDTRTATFGALSCVPANPGPRVVTTDWADGEVSCATATVAQSRTVTSIPRVWSDSTGQYVDSPESNWTVTTESRTRPMTEDERLACAGPQPPPDIVRGDWADGEVSCATATVAQSRTVTTTPKVLNDLGTEWVLDTAHAVTTTESGTRPMTAEEQAACPVDTVRLCGSFINYPLGSTWSAIAVYPQEEFLSYGPFSVDVPMDLQIDPAGLIGVTVTVKGPDGTKLSEQEYTTLPEGCVTYTYTPTPPKQVAIPGQPNSTDRCNPVGGTAVPPVWDATEDTPDHAWTVNAEGQKLASLRDPAATWSDGTTAPKVYDLPADNGVMCQVPNKDLVLPTVTNACAGVVKVTNPATNPSVIAPWGDNLVNTENISGELTVAPGATVEFTTTFGTVDLSFGAAVAGYNPYLLANFVTDQSPCVVTPPPTTPPPANPGPSTVVVSSDVADSVSCTDGTKRVETSTYSVPRIWVDGQYVNDPNHGNWKLVGSTTEIVALSAAELSECQQLPNTGSDPGPMLAIGLLSIICGGLLIAATRRRRVEG